MKFLITIICLFLMIDWLRSQELPPSVPQVPQINTDCGQNSSFKRCLTRCPLTCSNYLNPPKGCVPNCAIGCECHQGFIKVDKGPYSQCVRPFECALYGKKSSIFSKKLLNKSI
ncbi:venom peptide SjAPI-like [Oppia nitens]|uniref:venom peptide SjAPI-like n=1 Tax=Oppia nitens TaxID=1686743 RepID=UPI0023DA4357|nr:venom peptide SjAPI-like [Oppia nitens]